MKLLAFLLTASFVTLCSCLNAQDCMGYFPQEKHSEFEMSFFNPKGKVTMTTYYIVTTDKTSTGLRWNVDADVKDKKGESISKTNYNATCKNGDVEIDLMAMMNPTGYQSLDGMEVQVSGDKLLLPAGMRIGQTLPDASMEMKISNGVFNINGFFTITNRKVTGNEKISTGAGSFNCLVIEGDQSFKMVIGGNYQFKQWIAPRVGVVKYEIYNKNGKLLGYNELTELKI